MRATVMTFAVASLIVVAPTLAPVFAQDSAAAVPVATQPVAVRSPSVGSDTIRFGGRTIEAGDTVAGPVVVTAGDLRVRGVIRGTAITIAGLAYLALAVNIESAWVTALVTLSYLFFYTPMKRRSSLCMLVGAVPGALPPVIGWVAARGAFDVDAWVLFAIMFLWQVPHTLAIARLYREDFAKAGIQFLPVIEPEGSSTSRQIISHCAALLAVSLLPTLLGLAGAIYFVVAFVLGAGFLASGVRLAMESTVNGARRLLFASLIYLPVLLLVMALDRVPL